MQLRAHFSSLALTSRVVKSVMQSTKQISESLLYEVKNSRNCGTQIVFGLHAVAIYRLVEDACKCNSHNARVPLLTACSVARVLTSARNTYRLDLIGVHVSRDLHRHRRGSISVRNIFLNFHQVPVNIASDSDRRL